MLERRYNLDWSALGWHRWWHHLTLDKAFRLWLILAKARVYAKMAREWADGSEEDVGCLKEGTSPWLTTRLP